MYSEKIIDDEKQNWFLSFIKPSILCEDNIKLTESITEDEILMILKSFNLNKSPGIDGLPIEFYLRFFSITKTELCQIIKNSIAYNKLSDTQRRAIIIFLFKGGDFQCMSSWRPISLICVDCKIIAKLIAKRIKCVMNKCISLEQFCNKEKSIIDCNNNTRDILHYCFENSLTGAMVNIDLKRAFDSVNHAFLFNFLNKMGFSDMFISWIKVLYRDIESVCLVNGHLGDPLKVLRGVRKGCPLSMILYVISQEPLYQAIKHTKQIKPLNLPCKPIKLLGYADDTTFFAESEISIMFIFTILNNFESASGIRLNTTKTKIFGFGDWRGRTIWPYNLKVETSEINILGITYTHDFKQALKLSWTDAVKKIKQRVGMLRGRNLTIFQRAIIINTIFL